MRSTTAEDRDETLAAFEGATERLLVLLRSLGPSEAGLAVPGMDWTAGEVAAHVLSVFRRLTGDVRRGEGRSAVAALNDLTIAEIDGDLPSIIDEIVARLGTIREIAHALPLDEAFPFHAEIRVTYTQGVAVALGEIAVHGYDIAQATARPWEIEPEELLLVWRLAAIVLGSWLRPEVAAGIDETWALHMDGTDPVVLRVAQGRLFVDPEPAPEPDHVVTITDCVEFGLGFPFGRRPVHPDVERLASLFEPA